MAAPAGAPSLVLLFTDLLAVPLSSQRFLYPPLLTRLQVKRVALDLLDNVFGLHFALEAPQSVLKGFAFLDTNFCQEKHLQTRLYG
jgi:hypothetical protein